LALQDVTIPMSLMRDPWAKNEPGFGRDPGRTPMPWDGSENAGFTDTSPWLPLNADRTARNVTALAADAGSILNLYRRLIKSRRRHMALAVGSYVARQTADDVFSFERRHENIRLLVMLNFADVSRHAILPVDATVARVLLSTRMDREARSVTGELMLRPREGVILELVPA
jgi:alpha-glucosidase